MSNTDITTDLNFVRQYTIDNLNFSEIKESPIHGFGLFALEQIHPEQLLGVLDGQIMDWQDYDSISNKLTGQLGQFEKYICMEWNALNPTTLLVRPFRTKYSYINHSYQPNLEIQYNPIRIVAIKPISQGEEFTLDYSQEPLNEEYLQGHGQTYL